MRSVALNMIASGEVSTGVGGVAAWRAISPRRFAHWTSEPQTLTPTLSHPMGEGVHGTGDLAIDGFAVWPGRVVAFCYQRLAGFDKLRRRFGWLMINESQLRKRVLLRLIGHPVVIGPFLLGVSTSTVVWALNLPPGLAWFAAVAGTLGSIGAYLTRVMLDDGKTARTVIAELQHGEQQAIQAALDDLDRRLTAADKDPRPEIALRDLRELVAAFDQFAEKTDCLHSPVVLDVRSRVSQLFESSVRSLEQTLQLGHTAEKLRMLEARKPLLEQRERIITDIQAGIKQLGGTLAALQRLGTGTESSRELSRLRAELDQSLEVAGRVEARLNSLLDQGEPDIRSQRPRHDGVNNPKGD